MAGESFYPSPGHPDGGMPQPPDLVGRTRSLAKAVLLGAVALLVIAAVTNNRTFRTVARRQIHHRDTVKFALGGTMIALGLFTLFLLT